MTIDEGIHLVGFLVDGVESVVARLRHPVQIVNVVRLLVAEAPGQEHELAVAVHVVVELDGVVVGSQPVPHVAGLHLGEGGLAHVGVGAGVVGGAARAPVVAEVTIGICPETSGVTIWFPCLPPEPVLRLGEKITVRIDHWQNVPGTVYNHCIWWLLNVEIYIPAPVEVLQQVGVRRVVLHELLQHPGDGRRADPLPGVDTAVCSADQSE